MSNKITNPFLKQMISEIANKTNVGRLNISWSVIEEAKKKKKSIKKESTDVTKQENPPQSQQPEDRFEWENDPNHSRRFEKSDVSWREYDMDMNPQNYRVKEADEKKNPADDAGEEDAGGLPPLGGKDEAPTNEPKAKEDGKDAGAGAPPDGGKEDAGADAPAGLGDEEGAGAEDSEKAQADAAEAKAELEKAKAEKDQAEKEIKKNSYIKLGSNSGTQFLLGKILDHAFKTNTIDALAGEMVQKLKITTPDALMSFSEETASYRVIPGFPELLSSMKTMATKKKTDTEEIQEVDHSNNDATDPAHQLQQNDAPVKTSSDRKKGKYSWSDDWDQSEKEGGYEDVTGKWHNK